MEVLFFYASIMNKEHLRDALFIFMIFTIALKVNCLRNAQSIH